MLKKDVIVTTGRVRLSYVTLEEPRLAEGADTPKYSVMVLIPKSDKATLRELKTAEKNAYEKAVTEVWGGRRPKYNSILKDGDGVRERTGEPYGPECHGHYVMNVSSKRKPTVVDRDNQLISATEVKSGDYGRVNVTAFAYTNSGNRGVTFGLNHVQFLSEGEPLGGGISVSEAFGDPFDDDEDDDFDFED